MPTIFVPAQPYPKKANDNIRSSDWNAAINEVQRLSETTQYLDRSTFNGPLTISGALTASGGLTVTGGINGPLTVNGALTVSGLLTASNGLTVNAVLLTANKGLTVTGALLTAGAGLTVTGDETVSGKLTVNGTALSELKGPVTVSGLLTASAGLTVNSVLLTANKGLTVTGALLTAGAGLTVTGNQAVSGSLKVGSTGGMLEVGSLTRISQNTAAGWSCFGKNFYLSESGSWLLIDTSKPGVNLHMSADGANNQEFRFARREANSTTNVNLATIGTEGIVSNGKKVSTAGEFLYMIRGMVNGNGTIGAGAGFSVTRPGGAGLYQISFDPAFTATPAAVATQYITTNSDTRDNAVIVALAANSIRIRVGDGAGTAVDRAFTFIAVGLR